MSSRVAGAGLALIAAVLLAVSVATPAVLPGDLALFAGHPTIDGHTLHIKDVYVGPLDAQLCNTGGDGKCTPGADQERLGFRIAMYGELGATGLLAIGAVVLALLTLRKSERRHGAARVVRFAGLLAIGSSVALVVQGPFREATIPIGLGIWLTGGAIFAALLGSVLAVRPPPPIKLRVADRASQPVLPTGGAQSFDVNTLFPDERAGERRDGKRGGRRDAKADARDAPAREARSARETKPGERAREPKPRDPKRRAAKAASAPALPELFEDADSKTDADQPLFSAKQISQLRPLYEAAPHQGGTGGLLPPERPPLPGQSPAPLTRLIDADPRTERSRTNLLAEPPRADVLERTKLPSPRSGRDKPPSVPPPFAAPKLPGPPAPAPHGMPALPFSQPPAHSAPALNTSPTIPPLAPRPGSPSAPPPFPSPNVPLPFGASPTSPPPFDPSARAHSPTSPPPFDPSARARSPSNPPPFDPSARAHSPTSPPPFNPSMRTHAPTSPPPFGPSSTNSSLFGPPMNAPPSGSPPFGAPPHGPPPFDPSRAHPPSSPPPFSPPSANPSLFGPSTNAPRTDPSSVGENSPWPFGGSARGASPGGSGPGMPPRPGSPSRPPPMNALPMNGPPMVSGLSPHTQIAAVPPMPDLDAPVPPPPPLMPSDGRPDAGESPNTEPTVFPGGEASPPPMRPSPESRPPPLQQPRTLRAAVPMPARPGRASAEPTRPPPPPTQPPPFGAPSPRIPPPRATMTTTVPPPPGIPPIPPMPPIPVVPRSAEIDFELLVQLDDVDQATIAHVPLEIGDHTSETNISVGMPDDAGDEPTDGPAHLRVTTPGFIVPDTAPTPDVLFDNGFRASNDAHEAPTVPARDRGFVPPREPPVPLTPVSIAAPGAPIVRDRPMPRLPLSTAPDSLPPPKDSKVTSGPSPACPQCESPMAWVEEHLRFYCKSCRMYF